MSFSNTPYSYQPGSQRLLSPENPSSVASYTWNSSGSMGCDNAQISANGEDAPAMQYYLLKGEEPGVADQRPPVGGPSAPALLDALQTSLTVEFFGGDVTGRQPITYDLLWGPADPPGQVLNHRLVVAIPGRPGFYAATVTDLQPGTSYEFIARAINRDGIGSSPSAVFATLPTPPPGEGPPTGTITTPVLYGSTTPTSMAIRFNIGVVVSNPPLTAFQLLYGEEPNPGNEGLYLIAVASLVGGTVYEAYLEGLDPDTNYYVQARVENPYGDRMSLGAGPFRTQPGSGVPPQGGPFNTPVVAGSVGPTQLTIHAVAQAPISADSQVYMKYGPSASNLEFYEEAYVVGTGTQVWESELSQLQAGAEYFVQAVATTGTAPDIVSAIGGPFIGDSNPGGSAPTGQVSITTGTYISVPPFFASNTLNFAVRVANIVGNPTPTLAFSYGTSEAALNATVAATPSTVPGEEGVYRATVNNVPFGNIGVFAQCVVSNSAGQISGAVGGPYVLTQGGTPPAPPPPFPG